MYVITDEKSIYESIFKNQKYLMGDNTDFH